MDTRVAAYWGVRAESVDQCADRIARLIGQLAGIDPLLAGWRDTGRTKKEALAQPIVTPSQQDIADRLRRNAIRNDNDEIMEGAGYSVFWWNGQSAKAGGAALNINSACSTNPNLPRSMVLRLPDSSRFERLHSADTAKAIISAVITAFEPDHAAWFDDESLTAQFDPDTLLADGGIARGGLRGHPAGWATYRTESEPTPFGLSLLPASATLERTRNGTLVTLGDNPADPPLEDLLQVRRAMGYEVLKETTQTIHPSTSSTPAISADPASAPQSASSETDDGPANTDDLSGSPTTQAPRSSTPRFRQ